MAKRSKKVNEVLKRYKAGERNFQGVNLKGENLSDADLTNANFCNAKLQGTKFINATLVGANFKKAQAGRTRITVAGLVFGTLGLARVAGFGAAFAGDRIGWYFALYSNSSIIDQIYPITLVFVLAVIFLIVSRRGLNDAFGVAAFASAFFGIMAINSPFDGAFILAKAGVLGGLVLIAFSIAGARAIAGNWAGIVAFLCVLAGAYDNPVVGVFMLSKDISSTIATVEDYQITIANLSAGIVIGFGTWIGWRAFDGDEKYTFIQRIAFAFATLGGTNFYKADLKEANFSKASLQSAIFTEANLTRTRWFDATNIERIEPGLTYLKKAKVRDLVTKAKVREYQTKDGDFEGEALRELDLSEAELINFSFINANLSGTNLQNAKLRGALLAGANLELADLSGADLTGACIDDKSIVKSTKINGVKCEYIYLEYDHNDKNKRNLMPRKGKFKEGEFVDFTSSILDTLDLYINNDVDLN